MAGSGRYLPKLHKVTPIFINIGYVESQALPDFQACRILKNGKSTRAGCNRPQPLMMRGSSIWWRGQIDFGFW